MANNWQGYTNKMLFHSRVLLESWENADELSGSVFREACLAAMVQAYGSLLAEVVSNHRISIDQLPSLEEALQQVKKKGEVSSELDYIERLEQQNTWLSAMLHSAEGCTLVVNEQHRQQQIPLLDSTAICYDDPESLTKALESLKELVAYCRNFSLEW